MTPLNKIEININIKLKKKSSKADVCFRVAGRRCITRLKPAVWRWCRSWWRAERRRVSNVVLDGRRCSTPLRRTTRKPSSSCWDERRTHSVCWTTRRSDSLMHITFIKLVYVKIVLKDKFTFKSKCHDNLFTPMSSKMFMYFFLQSKRNQGFFI